MALPACKINNNFDISFSKGRNELTHAWELVTIYGYEVNLLRISIFNNGERDFEETGVYWKGLQM